MNYVIKLWPIFVLSMLLLFIGFWLHPRSLQLFIIIWKTYIVIFFKWRFFECFIPCLLVCLLVYYVLLSFITFTSWNTVNSGFQGVIIFLFWIRFLVGDYYNIEIWFPKNLNFLSFSESYKNLLKSQKVMNFVSSLDIFKTRSFEI